MCSNPEPLSQQLQFITGQGVFLLNKPTNTASSFQTCTDKYSDWAVSTLSILFFASVQVCLCDCVCVIFISLLPAQSTPPRLSALLFLWKSGWIQFTLPQDTTSSSYPLPLLLLPSLLQNCLFLLFLYLHFNSHFPLLSPFCSSLPSFSLLFLLFSHQLCALPKEETCLKRHTSTERNRNRGRKLQLVWMV